MARAAGAGGAPRPIQHPHDALLMEAIDVGQGDSLLLITPDGKTLLVDGGGFGGGPQQTSHPADEDLSAGTPAPQEVDIGEGGESGAPSAPGIPPFRVGAVKDAPSCPTCGLAAAPGP